MARPSLLNRIEPAVGEDHAAAAIPDPAVAVVDDALMAFVGRMLVSGDEVVDRLLDLRNALVSATLLRDLEAHDLAPAGKE